MPLHPLICGKSHFGSLVLIGLVLHWRAQELREPHDLQASSAAFWGFRVYRV